MNLKKLVSGNFDPIDYIIDYIEQYYNREYNEFNIKKINAEKILVRSSRTEYKIVIQDTTKVKNKQIPETIYVKGKISRKKCDKTFTNVDTGLDELVEYLKQKDEL